MAVQTTLQTQNRNVTREILDQEITQKIFIDTTVTPLTSGDYYRLFHYDANTIINEVLVTNHTTEGAAETTDITDDESGTTTLVSSHTCNDATTTTKYTTGLKKAAAGYISMKPDAALTAWKGWVVVKLIKLRTTD